MLKIMNARLLKVLFVLLVCCSSLHVKSEPIVKFKPKSDKVVFRYSGSNVKITGAEKEKDYKGYTIYKTTPGVDVVLTGDLRSFNCDSPIILGERISYLEIRDCPNLSEVICSNNFMSDLIIENCPKLRWLQICKNQLRGEVFDRLASSLPQCENGVFRFLNPYSGYRGDEPVYAYENNYMTDEQVQKFRDRGWAPMIYAFYDKRKWVDYSELYTVYTWDEVEFKTNMAPGTEFEIGFQTVCAPSYFEMNNVTCADLSKLNAGIPSKLKYTGTGGSFSVKGIVIRGITIKSDAEITSISCSNPANLYYLTCNNQPLSSIDLSKYENLENLTLKYNFLQELDLSKLPKLYNLTCTGNLLTELDVRNNPDLYFLKCDDNMITSLDISQNKKLGMLNVSHNNLTELDISNNPRLEEIGIAVNNIKREKMDEIVNHLVQAPTGKKRYLYPYDTRYASQGFPEGNECSKESMKKAKDLGWFVFTFNDKGKRIEFEGTDIVNSIDMIQDESDTIAEIYDLQGRRRASMARGVNIVKMKNGEVRKVVK